MNAPTTPAQFALAKQCDAVPPLSEGRVFSADEMQELRTFTQKGTTDCIHVLSDICAATGFKTEALLGKSRTTHLVCARWAAWKKLREMGHGYSKIGRWFGRHHTTIMHGIQEYEKEKESRPCLFPGQ
jgi:chromosomal replication initiation ATPase DnaA